MHGRQEVEQEVNRLETFRLGRKLDRLDRNLDNLISEVGQC